MPSPARLAVRLLFAGLLSASAAQPVVRVGYFPNLTHAQGVIGCETSREGRGWFEQRLGSGVRVEWYAFNAGPAAMEAIFAGSIDLTYTGPNPALNAYIRSRGEEIRVLAGAAEGGAALVVRPESGIARPEDFRGKKIATPELGNTQDVAARSWLKKHGLHITLVGGDATVLPTANPDQLALFQEGRVDAVWTVEPWVSRLLQQGGGRIFLEQSDAIATVLVSSVKFLREHPDLAEKFRRAHSELTAWIRSHPEEAQALVRAGLAAETHRELPASLVKSAWGRLHFTDRVAQSQFDSLVIDAQSAGFLRRTEPLDRLFSGRP